MELSEALDTLYEIGMIDFDEYSKHRPKDVADPTFKKTQKQAAGGGKARHMEDVHIDRSWHYRLWRDTVVAEPNEAGSSGPYMQDVDVVEYAFAVDSQLKINAVIELTTLTVPLRLHKDPKVFFHKVWYRYSQSDAQLKLLLTIAKRLGAQPYIAVLPPMPDPSERDPEKLIPDGIWATQAWTTENPKKWRHFTPEQWKRFLKSKV
jgi:hypothetical protein